MAALTLFAIDILTTLYGLKAGFEEGNKISLKFIKILGGEDMGVVAAQLSKALFLLLPLAVYKLFSKKLNPRMQFLYMLFYGLIILASIVGTFYVDVNNLTLILSFLAPP